MDNSQWTGSLGGPSDLSSCVDTEKRAIVYPPPAKFVVDMLPPKKQGNQYSYGMRIIPLTVTLDDRSSIFSSISDRLMDVEYDVYRRWEDCVRFQTLLEDEYRERAQMKRERLKKGKATKAGGLYLQNQAAASFESLPEGPDARSIAKDIHQYIPRLSQKISFRVTPAVVNQRHKEMQSFIEFLFHKDQPALIKELLTDRKVTDFFAYWRRDHEQAVKESQNSDRRMSLSPLDTVNLGSRSSRESPRTSFSSSLFSSISGRNRPPSVASSTSTEKASDIIRKYRARRSSTSSSSSDDASSKTSKRSSTSSEGSVTSWTSSEASLPSILVSDDTHTDVTSKHTSLSEYDFKPSQHPSQHLSDYDFALNDSPVGEFPENGFPEDSDTASFSIHVRRLPGSGRRSNRACSIYSAKSHDSTAKLPSLPEQAVRESWQTTSTITDILDGLNLSLPDDEDSTTLDGHKSMRFRDSMASISTVMTNRSAAESILSGIRNVYTLSSHSRSRDSAATFMTTESNGIVPRSKSRDSVATFMTTDSSMAMFPRTRDSVCSVATITPSDHVPRTRSPTPTREPNHRDSVASFDSAHQIDPSFLDQFPTPWGLAMPPISRPQTPRVPPLDLSKETKRLQRRRSSSLSSSSSSSSSPVVSSPLPPPGAIQIKAAYEGSIIMLRTSQTVSFNEVRQRLHAKFVKQEGKPLSKSFIVAAVSHVPFTQERTLGRKRSSSLSSPLSEASGSATRSILAESRPLQSITSQAEWEKCVATAQQGKLTLRVFDNHA